MSKNSAATPLHSKSSSKFEVKEDAYYNEQQILKVWDVYAKTKHLKYWFSNTEEGTSIFASTDSMNTAIRNMAGKLITLWDKKYSFRGAIS